MAALAEFIAGLPGLAARRVALGHGSFVTLDLGAPGAAWHVWIYCCGWGLRDGDAVIAHSDQDRSTIGPVVERLTGDTLASVELDGVRSRFSFGSGKVLETFPVDDAAQWMIHAPDGRVLTFEADGGLGIGR